MWQVLHVFVMSKITVKKLKKYIKKEENKKVLKAMIRVLRKLKIKNK